MKLTKIFIEASPLTDQNMSGIGHLTLELIKALEVHPDYGLKFEVILLAGFDRLPMLHRWKLKKVKYKAIPVPQRLVNLLWKFNMLPPMDLIIGRGTYVFPNYKNWWVPFSKSITYVHDVSFMLYPEFVAPKNQKFLERNMSRWLRRTTKVITISKNSQQEITEHLNISEEKVSVIYPGIDTTEFYRRSDIAIAKVKQKHGISGDYLLYVGNIEPRKNLVNLVNAYKALPAAVRDKYSLVLVGGNGWLNEPILEEINKAQKEGFKVIRPTNFVPDEQLPALYSGASLLTHPSLYEGFGLSLLQAMACGVPVIAGKNSSMTEVVGDAGLLVDANKPGDITATIKRVLEQKDLNLKLIDKGLVRVKDFSWHKASRDLIKTINELQD